MFSFEKYLLGTLPVLLCRQDGLGMILAHCNLCLSVPSNSPTSASWVARTSGTRHHTQLVFVFLVEMGFHHVGQDGFDLLTSWSACLGLPKCWDYRHWTTAASLICISSFEKCVVNIKVFCQFLNQVICCCCFCYFFEFCVCVCVRARVCVCARACVCVCIIILFFGGSISFCRPNCNAVARSQLTVASASRAQVILSP